MMQQKMLKINGTPIYIPFHTLVRSLEEHMEEELNNQVNFNDLALEIDSSGCETLVKSSTDVCGKPLTKEQVLKNLKIINLFKAIKQLDYYTHEKDN
jgi:hypothetical protein